MFNLILISVTKIWKDNFLGRSKFSSCVNCNQKYFHNDLIITTQQKERRKTINEQIENIFDESLNNYYQ